MTQETLSVPDVHCGHCKTSIEGAVSAIAGVSAADVVIEAHTLDVTYDGAASTKAAIFTAVEDQGYEVAS